MLICRQLPPEEFHRLGTIADPATSIAVVAEDDETHEIKGFWLAQSLIHIEPVWLSEELRDGGFTGLRLLAQLFAALAHAGVQSYYANAQSDEIASYLERLGMKQLPYLTYLGRVPPLPPDPAQEPKECQPQSQSQQLLVP